MPLAVLSFRKTKYFYKGKLDWDERSSAGRYVRENCKALRVQLASLLVFLLTCFFCHNCFPYSSFFELVVIGLRGCCLHSAVHRSIARVCFFHKQKQRNRRVLVRSFVLFPFKKISCEKPQDVWFQPRSQVSLLPVPYGATEKERTVRR